MARRVDRDPETRREIGGLERMREQIPLPDVAAERPQHAKLVRVLDALGDTRDAERRRHLEDHRRERRALSGLAELLDETTVDLHDVDREALEVRQRAVAGAEVVDRDPNTERTQLLEIPVRRLDLLDEHGSR